MAENILIRLIEHNNRANLQMIDVCEALTDEQLDHPPETAVYGTIRETLQHILLSQEDYVSMMVTFDHPPEREGLTWSQLRELSIQSGKALIELINNSPNKPLPSPIQVSDGYQVEPWVFVLQIINHATEHREQIKSMMSALGIEPPRIDGWVYGTAQNALIPPNA